MIRYFLYLLEEAGIHLRENKMAAVMTTLTLAFTMLLFGVFLWLYLNLSNLAENLRSEIRVHLYLKEGISQAQAAEVKERLELEPGISKVRFISKGQALEDFKKSLEGSDLLLNGLGENPLPASFELTLDPIYRSSSALTQLADRLRGIGGIEEVQYGREWVENVESWLWLFRIGAVGIGGLIAFTVVAIIANTIQLTLSLRRDEVEILRLIGATRRFIGIPFILEGTLIGLVSSVLALFLMAGLFHVIRQNLASFPGPVFMVKGVFFFPTRWAVQLVLMGVGLGAAGSYWSLRRWA
jgi:cell division transport system permease protein